jgi:hypothetical protein
MYHVCVLSTRLVLQVQVLCKRGTEWKDLRAAWKGLPKESRYAVLRGLHDATVRAAAAMRPLVATNLKVQMETFREVLAAKVASLYLQKGNAVKEDAGDIVEFALDGMERIGCALRATVIDTRIYPPRSKTNKKKGKDAKKQDSTPGPSGRLLEVQFGEENFPLEHVLEKLKDAAGKPVIGGRQGKSAASQAR